jgi:hypothetical protein
MSETESVVRKVEKTVRSGFVYRLSNIRRRMKRIRNKKIRQLLAIYMQKGEL